MNNSGRQQPKQIGMQRVIQCFRSVLSTWYSSVRPNQLPRWIRWALSALGVLALLIIGASLVGVMTTAPSTTLSWEVSQSSIELPKSQHKLTELAVAPDGTVYAVSDGQVFRREMDDEAWQLASEGITHPVSALLIDSDEGQYYAGTEGGGVFHSADGKTWQAVGAGLADLYVRDLLAGTDGTLFAATDGEGVLKFTEGDGWQAVVEGLADLDVTVLTMDDKGTLYAGTWGGGVLFG
jgi:ligand-binding sensor domain-containing protein